eukprot:TRINITY_DN2213_c0_g4_i1.p1 TRINITY_DN2213_c0_g4~~TRINITY_DN2213_c0_g4_i1.p1  ORF type:complete len:566 (+),score=160.56 TRINITY_DN2213_c0_g4_i1:114-1811(+)
MENPKPPKPATKEERRALQERQRAEKAAKKGQPQPNQSKPPAQTKPQASQPKQPQQPKQNKPPQAQPTSTTAPSSSEPSTIASVPKKGNPARSTPIQFDDKSKSAKAAKRQILPLEPSQKQVPLFSHLAQYERSRALAAGVIQWNENIPSYVVQLGLKFLDRSIVGSTARTATMMLAFKELIEEFTPSSEADFQRELETKLRVVIQFIVDCRPHSLSMGNAIKYLKSHFEIMRTYSCEAAKDLLISRIDSFLYERIVCAIEFIAVQGVSKIKDGDVLLTYARSQSVEAILTRAHQQKIKFKVIIVDSDPLREGKTLLNNLVTLGIECTYTLINAVSYVMNEATKVIVGASAVLSNGTVVSRAGTSVIALVANARHIPVLVACETFKFSERVQLDSITYNELGNPDSLLSKDGSDPDSSSGSNNSSGTTSTPANNNTINTNNNNSNNNSENNSSSELLRDWRNIPTLKLLNLTYDLTPTSLVDLLITDLGLLPPTSVPVILREYTKDPSTSVPPSSSSSSSSTGTNSSSSLSLSLSSSSSSMSPPSTPTGPGSLGLSSSTDPALSA